MNESGGREHSGRDATEPDDAQANVPHVTGWNAPIIDAPMAAGAADTEPATPIVGWGDDDWAWTYDEDFAEASPEVHEPAANDEAPTSPGVPAIPASATDHGAGRSRDGRRTAVGIAAVACFAILVGALAATTGGGGAKQPKRAEPAPLTTTTGLTTTTTTPVTTLPLTPTTILSSDTVVTRPPVVSPVPATSPPPTCNIVTQLLGCH